jgi:mRNA-degrading endonuclease RelE of RelBE toxin-antitoxin system
VAIAYTEAALQGLASIQPKKIRKQMQDRISALEGNPKPQGSSKIQGMSDPALEVYRVRQGDYRAIYQIQSNADIIVLDIDHRKDVYR